MAMSARCRIGGLSKSIPSDLPTVDADDLAVKASLAFKIKSIIQSRRLSDSEAAKLFGTTPAEISRLRNYQLEQYSAGRLMRFLVLLDHDVEICVRERQGLGRVPGIRTTEIRARRLRCNGWKGAERETRH